MWVRAPRAPQRWGAPVDAVPEPAPLSGQRTHHRRTRSVARGVALSSTVAPFPANCGASACEIGLRSNHIIPMRPGSRHLGPAFKPGFVVCEQHPRYRRRQLGSDRGHIGRVFFPSGIDAPEGLWRTHLLKAPRGARATDRGAVQVAISEEERVTIPLGHGVTGVPGDGDRFGER